MSSGTSSVKLLQTISLLRGLDAEQLRQVATVAERQAFPARTVVVRQGQPADALFAIVTGTLEVSTRIHAGQECVLGLMNAGEVIGEVGLLDGGRRAVTCTTVDSAELLVIERRHFLPLLRRSPAMASVVLEALAQRVRCLTHQASSDNIARHLEDWTRQGFLQVTGGRVVISDIEGVRRLARVAAPAISTHHL